MANVMFIQMSGAPGSGKTTLAQAIARRLKAVVIDHDVTKSALLTANVPLSLAGHASYMVLDAIARQMLLQGHCVIFDSPCFYQDLLERGQQLAQEAQMPYRYIECVVNDFHELDRRIRTRPRMPSQVTGIYRHQSEASESDETVFHEWLTNMKHPATSYLVLDTTKPLEAYLETALEYIATGIGNR